MLPKARPVCPFCGSHHLIANGRTASSRYVKEVVYSAWKCECGKAFTIGAKAELIAPLKLHAG